MTVAGVSARHSAAVGAGGSVQGSVQGLVRRNAAPYNPKKRTVVRFCEGWPSYNALS